MMYFDLLGRVEVESVSASTVELGGASASDMDSDVLAFPLDTTLSFSVFVMFVASVRTICI